MTGGFDYESKLWGSGMVKKLPFFFGATQIEFALKDLKGIKGKVLDIGCGGGSMAKAVKHYRPDLKVYAVDISESAVSKAKQDPSGVEFFLADALKLPFGKESFDGVLMFDLLEHLENPLKSLSEAYRVLRPGGVFSAFVPLEGSRFTVYGILKGFAKFIRVIKIKYAGHVKEFSLRDLEKLLKKTGFYLYKKRNFGHLFYQITDFLYFTFLAIRGKNVPLTVEGYISEKKGWKKSLFVVLKSLVALICYLESKILWFLPASGVHLTARRPT